MNSSPPPLTMLEPARELEAALGELRESVAEYGRRREAEIEQLYQPFEQTLLGAAELQTALGEFIDAALGGYVRSHEQAMVEAGPLLDAALNEPDPTRKANDTMNDHAKVTAAPATLVLSGREFRMSPLTDRDIAEIDQWLQSHFIDRVRRSFTAEMVDSERTRELGIAYGMAGSVTMLSDTGVRMLATVDGMAKLVLQSLRKHHPTETVDTIRAMMLDPENIDLATRTFNDLNKGPAARGSPKNRRRGRR